MLSFIVWYRVVCLLGERGPGHEHKDVLEEVKGLKQILLPREDKSHACHQAAVGAS